MVVTPTGDPAPIAWQSTVVDIHPSSRYDPSGDTPDTAVVSTTLGLLGQDDQVRAMRLSSTIPVYRTEPIAEAPYRFSLRAPEEFTALVKDADLSIVVLLPRLPSRDPALAPWAITIVDYTRDGEPVLLEADGPGRRPSVSWYTRQDPDSIVDYIYDHATR